MKYITVCKQTIQKNLKYKQNKPAIRVCEGKYGKPKYYKTYKTKGNIRIICDMLNPLPWGARVWIEEKST